MKIQFTRYGEGSMLDASAGAAAASEWRIYVSAACTCELRKYVRYLLYVRYRDVYDTASLCDPVSRSLARFSYQAYFCYASA